MSQDLRIGGVDVAPGEVKRLELPVARLPSRTMLHLPLTVYRGRGDGPRLWLSAALHGDELNGMEIIRRVLGRVRPRRLRGLLIAAPVVNVFGFVNQSRYLPDRRDLNRSFPGSKGGSLAARLARLFMNEVVSRCTHGIDLHTAAPPRINLPQVRAALDDPETRRCALAFGAPVMVDAAAPKGTLRAAALRRGITVLLYEAGEPLRFNDDAIRIGVEGVLRVMSELGMIGRRRPVRPAHTIAARRSAWVRAPQSGVLYLDSRLGQFVRQRDLLGEISDPFGDTHAAVRATLDGIVIGQNNVPLVHRGDGIVHIAEIPTPPRSRP